MTKTGRLPTGAEVLKKEEHYEIQKTYFYSLCGGCGNVRTCGMFVIRQHGRYDGGACGCNHRCGGRYDGGNRRLRGDDGSRG